MKHKTWNSLFAVLVSVGMLIMPVSNSFSIGIMPPPKTVIINNAGKLCVSCKVCTYEPGTVIPKTTYTDSSGATANTNPVVTNSRGEASIWYSGTAKIKVMAADQTVCATGTALYTQDGVPAVENILLVMDEWIDTTSTTWTYISGTQFSVSADKTAEFQAGRRIKATSGSVIYGRINTSTYSAPNTTVTVAWDSGSLDAGGITDMQVSLLSVTNPAISFDMITSGTTGANVRYNGISTFSNTIYASPGAIISRGTNTFYGKQYIAQDSLSSGGLDVSVSATFSRTTTFSGDVTFRTSTPAFSVSSIESIWDSRPRVQSVTKATDYLITSSDMGKTIIANPVGVTASYTLPVASNGAEIFIKNISTMSLTIAGTVDGVANPTLNQYEEIRLWTDGTSWYGFSAVPTTLVKTNTYSIAVADFNRTLISSSPLVTATITAATPAVITANNHGYVAGQVIGLTTTGTLPNNFNVGTPYYVLAYGLAQSTFSVATSAGGTAISAASKPITIATGTPSLITANYHLFQVDDPVTFSTTGTLPTNFSPGTTHYVLSGGLATNTFAVATTPHGTAVWTSAVGSGIHTVTRTDSGTHKTSKRMTHTLPAASSVSNGFVLDVKNISPLPAVISGNIDNTSSKTLNQYDELRLVSDGTSWFGRSSRDLPGNIVQSFRDYIDGTYTCNTTYYAAVPQDDTKPQKAEGCEIFTIKITPTLATNKLRIEGFVSGTNSNEASVVASLYQDTQNDPLNTSYTTAPAGTLRTQIYVAHEMTASTTSEIIFHFRVGPASNNFHINGDSAGARTYGGASQAWMRVQEIAQ